MSILISSGSSKQSIDLDFRRPFDLTDWQFQVQLKDTLSIRFLDVYFLVDTTGSMQNALEAIGRSLNESLVTIARILTRYDERGVYRETPDIAYGFGQYKDFQEAPACVQNVLPITSYETATVRAGVFQRAIAEIASSGGGGGDVPECQIFALNTIATSPVIGWRPQSLRANLGSRTIAWYGDAPGHDPSGGITTLEALFNLKAGEMNVSGTSIGGDGLNDPI
jgi:hypothetical protein